MPIQDRERIDKKLKKSYEYNYTHSNKHFKNIKGHQTTTQRNIYINCDYYSPQRLVLCNEYVLWMETQKC